jgi:hypothetical protein
MLLYEKQVVIELMGLTNVVEGAIHSKFSYTVENCKGLNTASGLGVTSPLKRASIAGGIFGVVVSVGVSVTEGVSVMVGVSVIVGDNVMDGTGEIVGVRDGVGEGGK